MKKLCKKIFIFFLIVLFCASQPLSAGAVTNSFGSFISGGGASKAKGQIRSFFENDLNINIKEGLRPFTEQINVMDRKGQMPEVTIRFSTPNPKPGEHITATADVMGIENSQDAYFTWYLKGPKRSDGSGSLAQHKLNAVRAAAAVYFDPLMFDQPMNNGNGDGILQSAEWPADADDDGFDAPLGGANVSDTEDRYCYMFDVNTGELYEKGGDEDGEDGCAAGYVARCLVEKRELQCPANVDPIEGEITTEASSSETSNTASASSTTEGEIEGVGGVRSNILTQCLDVGEKPMCNAQSHSLYCGTADGETNITYSYDGPINIATPFCVKKMESGKLWQDPNANGCFTPGGDEEIDGGTSGKAGNGCGHYVDQDLLRLPQQCSIASQSKSDKTCRKSERFFNENGGNTPGDGRFDSAEEKAYGLNPLTSRTTPLSLNDEAFAIGLGVNALTWEYQEGDEIGVVVEGLGTFSTKHEDAASPTVFALLKPGCGEELSSSGAYEESVKDKNMTIKTGQWDLDACVARNNLYVKPGTSEYDALNVSVSHGSNQATSVSSGLGEPVHITATAGQIQGGEISSPQNLYYEWDIKCKGSENITNDPALGVGKTEGMNLPSLDFTADFPDSCFDDQGQSEIEVTAKINEPRKGGGSNFGQSVTKFTAYNAKDSLLNVYKTKRTTGNTFSIDPETQPICGEAIDKTLCRVMNNEVIAVSVPGGSDESIDGSIEDGMISWTVNGKPYSCDTSISDKCNDTKNTKTIIVPMKGRDGDTIAVTAHMSTVDADTNQSRQIMRVFRVTDPAVTITPVSGAVPKVLGVYRGFHDQQFLDESTNVLNATETTVTLKAALYPNFLNAQNGTMTYEWYINGQLNDEKTNKLTFAPDGVTTVMVKVQRSQTYEDRDALNMAFGIQQEDSMPTTFTHTVEINTDTLDTLAQGGKKGFFATVAHNTPEYFLFLLKITLLMSIMLFIPSMVLGAGRE